MKLHPVVLTVLLFVQIGPAYGAGYTLAEEIKSFNSGSYSKTALLGKEIVRLNPTDTTARYYLAQALVKLNRNEEAVAQFSKCYNTTKNATMKSYCYKALQNLLAGPSDNRKAAQVKNSVPASINTAGGGSGSNITPTSKPAPAATTNIDASAQARKMQILEAGAKEIDARRAQLNSDLQRAKERSFEQMRGIPQFIERPVYRNGFRVATQQIENPDYRQALMQSQKELADTTEQATREFERHESEITEECKRQAAAYDQVISGLKSQQQAGNSQIQLLPQNSSIYVRHFINYDGSAPVGIKTRQTALSLKGEKNTVKNGKPELAPKKVTPDK